MMNLLLLSSSKVGDSGYLESAQQQLYIHFSQSKNIVFIPYAGVSIDWDSYTQKVQDALPNLNISGIHQHQNAVEAIKSCDGIMVGGGNTFNLLNQLYQQDVISAIQAKVKAGTPYAGWSAGSNIAGDSIRTTNDMPIVEPPSFKALQLVSFQINPHYTDYQPPGHNGETREERLQEFMQLNPSTPVVAIPEGVGIKKDATGLCLVGELPGYLFLSGNKQTLAPHSDISNLI